MAAIIPPVKEDYSRRSPNQFPVCGNGFQFKVQTYSRRIQMNTATYEDCLKIHELIGTVFDVLSTLKSEEYDRVKTPRR